MIFWICGKFNWRFMLPMARVTPRIAWAIAFCERSVWIFSDTPWMFAFIRRNFFMYLIETERGQKWMNQVMWWWFYEFHYFILEFNWICLFPEREGLASMRNIVPPCADKISCHNLNRVHLVLFGHLLDVRNEFLLLLFHLHSTRRLRCKCKFNIKLLLSHYFCCFYLNVFFFYNRRFESWIPFSVKISYGLIEGTLILPQHLLRSLAASE